MPMKQRNVKTVKLVFELFRKLDIYNVESSVKFFIPKEVIRVTMVILSVCPSSLMVPRVEEATP